MSGRHQDSPYYPRARVPQSRHAAPNNVGVVLLVMVLLAIIATLALVGPGLIGEVREMMYCLDRAQEAVCS